MRCLLTISQANAQPCAHENEHIIAQANTQACKQAGSQANTQVNTQPINN